MIQVKFHYALSEGTYFANDWFMWVEKPNELGYLQAHGDTVEEAKNNLCEVVTKHFGSLDAWFLVGMEEVVADPNDDTFYHW